MLTTAEDNLFWLTEFETDAIKHRDAEDDSDDEMATAMIEAIWERLKIIHFEMIEVLSLFPPVFPVLVIVVLFTET